jgi:hypothetical protein
MLNRGAKIAVGVLAVPTVLCALLAGLQVYHEVWGQWSALYWVNMWSGLVHSPFILVPAIVALTNLVLLLLVGIWWLVNIRNRAFSHRIFAAWFALLLVSAVSYFPSDQQYAAAAVMLLGPGPKSVQLQRDAALRDSSLLLNALILRGADIEKSLLCFAAYNDSPSVITRLIQRGMQVNEQHYPSRVTALHQAVEGKQHRSAEILMRAGARADIPNLRGITPRDLAARQGDERMMAILTR